MTSPAPTALRRLLPVVLLDCIAFGVVLPLLPAAGAKFVSHAVLVGLLVALDSCVSFVLAPRWGRLSDRIGRRPVLLIGLAGTAAGYALFAVAPSFLVLLLSRVVTGATSTVVTVSQAALADVTAPERRARALGFVGAAFGVGFTVGPAIGGLAGRVHESLPGLIAVGLALLNTGLGVWLVPETRPAGAPVPARPALPAAPFSAALRALREPVLQAHFATTLAFTAMYVLFPLWCQAALGWPRPRVSSTYVVLGLVTIVVQGRLVGRLVPRLGDGRVATLGALLLAAGCTLLPFITADPAAPWRTAVLVVTGVALVAAGFSLAGPAQAARLSRLGAADTQGGAFGTLASAGAMARIVGPPAIGLLTELGGFAAGWAAAAVAAAGAMLLLREAVPFSAAATGSGSTARP